MQARNLGLSPQPVGIAANRRPGLGHRRPDDAVPVRDEAIHVTAQQAGANPFDVSVRVVLVVVAHIQKGVLAVAPHRGVQGIRFGLEQVNAFPDRPLEGEWPYLWLDSTYLKQREGGRIVSVIGPEDGMYYCCKLDYIRDGYHFGMPNGSSPHSRHEWHRHRQIG